MSIHRKLNVLFALAAVGATGCSSMDMHVAELPGPGESTRVGSTKVRVVDLDISRPASLQARSVAIPPQLLARGDTSYKIGPFDVLIVTVWEHPELTQPLGQYRSDLASGQLVDADGTMFFPYTGRIKVAGLTAPQVQRKVTESLAKSLRDPQVDIKVAAYRSQRIYVTGEVRTPGVFTIDDVPMNLPEALHRAGGLTPTGDLSSVWIVRKGKSFELDLASLQEAGAPVDSIRLLPGDQIRVANAQERVAYVLGEVTRPNVVNFTNGRTTLIRALTEAGGFNTVTANAAGVYVVRAEDTANVTVFRLDGRSPVALAFAGQFQLRPRDLVYVDQSGLSRWNQVFQMLVPMSTVLSGTTGSAVNIQTLKTQPW